MFGRIYLRTICVGGGIGGITGVACMDKMINYDKLNKVHLIVLRKMVAYPIGFVLGAQCGMVTVALFPITIPCAIIKYRELNIMNLGRIN